MITRSFGPNGQFEVSDWTQEITTIQNQWGTIGQLGIFREIPVSQNVVVFESRQENGNLIIDQVRGSRANVAKGTPRQIHTFAVPHFPLDDAILPQDLQGQRAYNSNDVDKLAQKRAEKMLYIRRAHARTLEVARAQAIVQGTAYSPSGTVTQDWNAEFGVTRTVVSFALAAPTTDVLGKIEQVIAAIQDNAGMVDYTGIIGLCSSTFFQALITAPAIKQAYQYYASTQEPLRQRQAAGGSAIPLHREFYFGGIMFREMRDAFNGVKLIPDGDAYFIPQGTDAFATYFGPADRFPFVNTDGEQVYLFENMAQDGTAYTLQSESNHISALLRPELVIRGTLA